MFPDCFVLSLVIFHTHPSTSESLWTLWGFKQTVRLQSAVENVKRHSLCIMCWNSGTESWVSSLASQILCSAFKSFELYHSLYSVLEDLQCVRVKGTVLCVYLLCASLLSRVVLCGDEGHLADGGGHSFLPDLYLDGRSVLGECRVHVTHGDVGFQAGGGAATGHLTYRRWQCEDSNVWRKHFLFFPQFHLISIHSFKLHIYL